MAIDFGQLESYKHLAILVSLLGAIKMIHLPRFVVSLTLAAMGATAFADDLPSAFLLSGRVQMTEGVRWLGLGGFQALSKEAIQENTKQAVAEVTEKCQANHGILIKSEWFGEVLEKGNKFRIFASACASRNLEAWEDIFLLQTSVKINGGLGKLTDDSIALDFNKAKALVARDCRKLSNGELSQPVLAGLEYAVTSKFQIYVFACPISGKVAAP